LRSRNIDKCTIENIFENAGGDKAVVPIKRELFPVNLTVGTKLCAIWPLVHTETIVVDQYLGPWSMKLLNNHRLDIENLVGKDNTVQFLLDKQPDLYKIDVKNFEKKRKSL